MNILFYILQKEFKQVFRNKPMIAIIFVVPIIQFLILPLAADFEIKNINIALIDNDKSTTSRLLINKITASGYFRISSIENSFKQALKKIELDKADLILEFPANFEKSLYRESNQKVLISINSINGIKANLGGFYLINIINEFNNEIQLDLKPTSQNFGGIDIRTLDWFNPNLNYKIFLIPGLLAILVTMVGGFLTALNIVREKELGTIEQINVTPIKKWQFILSKLIPFWILANLVFTNGLILGYLIYDIVPKGNLLILYCFIDIYLLAVLGLGLLISTISETQQQAMFVMFFFMIIFILLGGLFTPIDSMPTWAQYFAHLNPVKYVIEAIRLVMLKGSGFEDIIPQTTAVFLFAIIINFLAIINYRKTI
ncbi:MAG: ABC transporter permease [Candidatus Kapabacteria bacterium]|nr:ABC transporter permease [Candidatus Kapabacteria bacterium]